VIHLDTSALIASITADRPAAPFLRSLISDGERLGVSTLVLFEWWRGPRLEQELAYQELLLPRGAAVAFGAREARLASDLYTQLGRPRQRSIDIAIAACALAQEAALWTLNPKDFKDIPGLQLV
jgi:predicted nucleic acid-binding protein